MQRAAQWPAGLWLLVVVGTIALAIPLHGGGWALAGPSAQAYVEQAVNLYNKGECVRAVDLLKKAITADSRYVRAYAWLGLCYARLGRSQDAIAAFNRVVALAPKSDDATVARQWIARLQRPAGKQAAAPLPPSADQPAQTGVVYLVTLPAAAGVAEGNQPRAVQLFGEVYRRALVERRNWWQGRRATEREWRVVYNLQRRFVRFRARTGVEDGSPPEFAAAFEVRADGNTLYEGKPKRAGDVPDALDFDVTGVLQLELIVRGKDLLYTRDLSVVWADPHVELRPAASQPQPAPVPSGSQGAPPGAPPSVAPPTTSIPGS